MFTRLTIFCAWLVLLAPVARGVSPLEFKRAITAGTHESLSGQFIVHDAPPMQGYLVDLDRLTNMVRLDPTLLAVSVERIKKAVLNELGERDQWRDRIALNLHHTLGMGDGVTITPVRFDRDWLYRVNVPDHIDREQLISAIVQVVLLERVNRTTAQSAELPDWLVQGLSREIRFLAQAELVVEPPKQRPGADPYRFVINSGRRADPLMQAHEKLRTVPPLTLEQLSWPREWQFSGAAADAYGCSAQLFFHDLLSLPDGHAAMRAFLSELPRHLNWQISFLQAFRADFANQRALDKWWALDVVQFTGRDLTQTWGSEESWRKLDQMLSQPVEVRSGLKDPPMRSQVSLSTIIHDWEVPRQKEVLREKSQQLAVLRLRVSQDLVYLVDDYRRVLDSYLAKKDFGIYIPLGKSIYAAPTDDYAKTALQQLAVLEARRAQLRPKPSQAVAVSAR